MKINTYHPWEVLSLLMVFFSCGTDPAKKTEEKSKSTVLQTKTATASANCGAFCDPPTVSYQLPVEVCNLSQQVTLNCFAWTNFLALNWNASNTRGLPDSTLSAAKYGVPGDYSPTVWESFLTSEEVFTDHGPTPWKNNNLKRSNNVKRMTLLNKTGNVLTQVNKKVLRAAGTTVEELFQAEGKWLTAQDGNLVWYEVKMNLDEYNFITKNQLYDAAKQIPYAIENNGIWLPGGPSSYGNQGAMELKAAWKVVDSTKLDSAKQYYKISKAMVPAVLGFDNKQQPILGHYSMQYMALVGLHIIRKTNLAHQFVWMTFEHVNTAPTEEQVSNTIQYDFYNKNSTAKPNQSPNPKTDNIKTPVQVMRIAANALNNNIQQLNNYAHDIIRQSNPTSIWQYYQLVNVQWPQSPVEDNANNGGRIPLNEGGITPTNMANTTLETYVQGKYCMSCHKAASVKAKPADSTNATWASGYSFIFSNAKMQKK
jgi:hypothetical protein